MDYQEKLRLAKEALDSGSYDKETIEYIFPELKNSEDDRVRKCLITFFRRFPYDSIVNAGTNAKEALAWLENQGHDGKKWIYEDVYLKEKEQLIQDGIDEVLENPQKYGLEKQGEQKPDNKAESMEYNYITPNPEFFQWIYDRLVHVHNENPNVDFMLSLKERIEDMQKPFDKCEPKFKVGDYIERKDGLGCHAKIIFVGENVYGCEKLIYSEDSSPFFELMFKNQDLFRISSDFQQNPSWREEDERIYNEILDFFLGDVETRCTTIDKQRHFGYWLKSLKPNHWKPSDEQIKSLRIALQTMPYSKDKENVLVILEQLMKL